MTVRLVGANDASGSGEGTNTFILTKYTAIASGNMTQFYVCSGVAGNVKCALYADSGGEPAALLTAMNTGQAVAGGGWTALSFTSTPIVSGTAYWLAINIDTYGCVQYVSTGIYRYKGASYGGFTFPDPAGSSFTASTAYRDLVAGWGTLSGWSHISHDKGVTASAISHKKGVAVASISHIKGVAV